MVADRRIAVGSPIVVHVGQPDVIQYAGGAIHFICEAINPWLDRKLSDRGTAPANILAAPTCALLLDRAVAIDVELTKKLRHFVRRRKHGGSDPPLDQGYGVRITFSEPVSGPLVLGYGSHFGLGLFERADNSTSAMEDRRSKPGPPRLLVSAPSDLHKR